MKPAEIKWTCHGAPVQAEGQLPDGNWWYFRSRHNHWTFTVSKTYEGRLERGVFEVMSEYGKETESASWMPQELAAELITKCIEIYEANKWQEN